MSAGKHDILIEQGATFILPLQLRNEDGTNINITGDTFAGQIRKSPENTTTIATFNSTIIEATTGKVNMSLSSVITAALTADDSGDCKRALTCFVYDIERTRASGEIDRILEGVAYLSPEVTK